jgi:hypothetical protein
MSEINTYTLLKQRGTRMKSAPEEKIIIDEEPIKHQEQPESQIKEKKPRKPKTEKQMESFKLVAAKRQENIKQQKIVKKIEASKYLLEHDELPYKAKLKAKSAPKQISIDSDNSSSDESQPKIIIKKVHKKKKKPVIIHVESSDEESTDEEEPIEEPIKKNKFISQKNKKSLIQIVPVKKYFVDY